MSTNPKDTERFALRTLLLHVPGAKSYEDLRTVNDVLAPPFHAACKLRNLLTDDTQWEHTLAEAVTFQMPHQLRLLFAVICSHCDPLDPQQLWHQFKDSMMEDYARSHNHHTAENMALLHINNILAQSGLSCSHFNLPTPLPTDDLPEYNQPEINDISLPYELLNNDQRLIVDTIITASINTSDPNSQIQPHVYYLDGPGGTGKTTVYNTIISMLSIRNIKVHATAWTGIAATLLRNGCTVHSLFKLPVPILDTSTCNVTPKSAQAKHLRAITLFIIDEVSMLPLHALHAIDTCLRDITGNNNTLFGGKIILLGGDFRQVLPFTPRASRTKTIENCIKNSPLWPQILRFHLTKNMRADAAAQDFSTWLLTVGNGTLQSNLTDIPYSIDIPSQCKLSVDIVNDVFQDMTSPVIQDTVLLTPKNEDALKLNKLILDKIPTTAQTYISSDSAICEDPTEQTHYPMEFLNSLTPTGMPPHILKLKVGAIIMLLRNLDIKGGLCNGTRLKVVALYPRTIHADIITGTHVNKRVFIPRIKLAPSDANLPFTQQRHQFPIRLAYAITINKAQGQTFHTKGIYLPKPVFSHGQLYVALSRTKSLSSITVQINPSTRQSQSHTQNIVYKEIL
ncbi:ATP-dependent DNA helicase PIF1-like [Lineus longissimus]|uniref:ATP-dependent DNA helicase PIF1-like n=1 Tax=Lineus longissimus TaxID=88925 RepID=UPI00315D7D59